MGALAIPRCPRRASLDPRSVPVDAAHAEIFDFEEFLDAAFLHAAKGGDLAAGFGEMMPSLMPTMPYSGPSATR